VDEDAAACATIMVSDSVAGVWNVGTLRPFRRQGLASAILMQALVEAAEEGYADSVLVASPMGRSLYEEMGFRLIGNTYHYGPLD
jgi:predicted acetyltransferase